MKYWKMNEENQFGNIHIINFSSKRAKNNENESVLFYSVMQTDKPSLCAAT